MGVSEKIADAKKTNWLTEGIPEAEVKTIVELAKISAKIERYRILKGMTQKQFADYMGVSQGMVSKWESREYNFTIKTLNEICQKIDMEFTVELHSKCKKNNYTVIRWDEDITPKNTKNIMRIDFTKGGEAIA